jgi:hypothetical protein
MHPTITLPAYAGDTLGETITLHAPEEWHDRLRALAPHLVYGPDYRRAVVFALNEMSRTVAAGYSALAYDYLLAAERATRITSGIATLSPTAPTDFGNAR